MAVEMAISIRPGLAGPNRGETWRWEPAASKIGTCVVSSCLWRINSRGMGHEVDGIPYCLYFPTIRWVPRMLHRTTAGGSREQSTWVQSTGWVKRDAQRTGLRRWCGLTVEGLPVGTISTANPEGAFVLLIPTFLPTRSLNSCIWKPCSEPCSRRGDNRRPGATQLAVSRNALLGENRRERRSTAGETWTRVALSSPYP